MTTIEFCEEELGMDHDAVVDYNNYLHEVCTSHLLASSLVIGGQGHIVEIDEGLFSCRENQAGRVLL